VYDNFLEVFLSGKVRTSSESEFLKGHIRYKIFFIRKKFHSVTGFFRNYSNKKVRSSLGGWWASSEREDDSE